MSLLKAKTINPEYRFCLHHTWEKHVTMHISDDQGFSGTIEIDFAELVEALRAPGNYRKLKRCEFARRVEL